VDIQITRISKPDGNSMHEQITHLGDSERMWPKWDVICWIEEGETTFYTMIGGKRADIHVREVKGFKYVQTAVAGSWKDDLLVLPRVPRTPGEPDHRAKDEWARTMVLSALPLGDMPLGIEP
jgi:hypothetical protein